MADPQSPFRFSQKQPSCAAHRRNGSAVSGRGLHGGDLRRPPGRGLRRQKNCRHSGQRAGRQPRRAYGKHRGGGELPADEEA